MGGDTPEPQETKYEMALAHVAKLKWQDYKKRYVPFENKAMEDVTDVERNKVMVEKVAGQANADLAEQMPLSTLPPGVDPSSGAAVTALNAVDKASRGGNAISGSRQSARDLRVQGLQAAVDIGRGQATDAQLGMEGLAESAVKKEIGDAYSDYEKDSASEDMFGTALGVGAAGVKDYFTRYK